MDDAFRARGHMTLGVVLDGDELDWFIEVADSLVASDSPNVVQNLVGAGSGPPRVAQVMAPGQLVPDIEQRPAVRQLRERMADWLGQDTETHVAMVITKPARDGGEVPWHQDAAYWDQTVRHCAASIWIPLQDVDEGNGCLQFVPGSHRGGVLPHERLPGDPSANALQLTQQAVKSHVVGAVSVPLGAGEASLHDGYTLHKSGPNPTDLPRRAVVLSVRNHSRDGAL